MIRKFLLAALAVAAIGALLAYLGDPVFWHRYVQGFLSAGDGAYSAVFEPRERVPGGAPRPIPKSDALAPETRAALSDYAERFESFALLVLIDGQLAFEWYRADYDRDSLTQSQSMHKSVQALLVGIAIDQGLIASIDDPLRTYLPNATLADPETSIRNVLEMRSGLEPFSGSFSPFGDAFRWLYSSDIRAATLAVPQTSAPGDTFDYHDANSQLIGMLLDTVFGQRYADYLSTHLWQPLGNADAFTWLDQESGMAHHNCCLLARAIDWARLGQMIVDGGRVADRQIVSEAWLDEQFSPGGSPHYGLHTWLANNEVRNPREGAGGYRRSEDWLADDVVYFSGYGAQRVYMSRGKRIVIVRLGPAAGYFPEIIESWDNSYLVNTIVRSIEGG